MRRSGRALTRWAIAAALLISLAVMPAAAQDSGSGQPKRIGDGFRGVVPEGSKELLRLTRAQVAELAERSRREHRRRELRADRLEQPRAERARRRSRGAHEDLSGREALAVLKQEFDVVEADIPDPVAEAGKKGELVFLDDFTLRVERPGGRKNLLAVSTKPLRARTASGRKEPVDLDLEARGSSFAPKNSLSDVTLPKDLDRGIRFSDSDMKLEPGRLSRAASAGRASGGGVFYANTGPDTDLYVTPVPTGLATAIQLRSPDSPQLQRLDFDLPRGARLRLAPDGDARVVRSGEEIAHIHAPEAIDAQGQSVPARYRTKGETLEVFVPHRRGDYAMPILVDPLVEDWSTTGPGYDNSWYGGQTKGVDGWYHETYTPDLTFWRSTVGTGVSSYGQYPGRGLYTYADPNIYYPGGAFSYWAWRVPGQTTFIDQVNLDFIHFNWHGDPYGDTQLHEGIYNQRAGAYNAILYNYGEIMPPFAPAYHSLRPYRGTSYTPGVVHHSDDVQGGQHVIFALYIPYAKSRAWTDTYLGGAIIWLQDPEAPTLDG